MNSAIPVTHPGAAPSPRPPTPPTTPAALPASLIGLLAAGAGFSVASIYYSQPMLGLLGSGLASEPGRVGWVPTMTQLGYAGGILLLAPLGDRFDRRTIIVVKALLLMLALLASAAAPALTTLLVASLVVGLSATMAQDIVPAAATLAPADRRGKIVGSVMTGLLLGILLSRVVSGVVAAQWGWRSMYALAALAMAVIGVALWRGLPRFAPTTTLPYGALLGSMIALWRRHPTLRRAAITQGLLSVGFSAFWSTLAVMLHSHYGLGSAVAGSFGLAGAAGALAAPLAGRGADRRGPARVIRFGIVLAIASFAALALAPWLGSGAQIGLIAVSAIGFDFGIQAAMVAHQTIVYGIDPDSRSRLNAVFFTTVFIGMASGSALGSLALSTWDWPGVVALAVASAMLALAVSTRGRH